MATKLEELRAEMHEHYWSELVDTEVMAQTAVGLSFIKIENYISELEKTIENLKKQIK